MALDSQHALLWAGLVAFAVVGWVGCLRCCGLGWLPSLFVLYGHLGVRRIMLAVPPQHFPHVQYRRCHPRVQHARGDVYFILCASQPCIDGWTIAA